MAIVTGSGRGLGREHALLLAREGASVVVNDLGADVHGRGVDPSPAYGVVSEIQAAGGQACLSGHDVADWSEANALIELAVDTFGDLHVLVNNAGILRDRTIANTSEDEWDAVIRVHLRGHAAPTRHAMAYWRQQAKRGNEVKASVIHTTSIAGFVGNFGQANYSSAKMAILGLSAVVALEGRRYGVRSNAVAPSARTRLALGAPGGTELHSPQDSEAFDPFDPANVSPLVAWLAQADCLATGQVFHIYGSHLRVLSMPHVVHRLEAAGMWTLEALDRELPKKLLKLSPAEEFIADWRD